jgi:hypothetical protein
MTTDNTDAGCPEDRTNRVYNYSFLALMRKSPNENPVQFYQCCGLVLDFVLEKTNLINLVIKQPHKKISLVV